MTNSQESRSTTTLKEEICAGENCAFSRNITTCAELICATIRPCAVRSCAREKYVEFILCDGLVIAQNRTNFSPHKFLLPGYLTNLKRNDYNM